MNRKQLDRNLAEATPASDELTATARAALAAYQLFKDPELAKAVREAIEARDAWLATEDGQRYTESKAIGQELVRKLIPFVHYTDEELEL